MSLESHMLDAHSKTFALLFQNGLLVGPSAEDMIRFLSRVRCILTDVGTEGLIANMVDCFAELFQLMCAPAQGLPRRMHTFDLCLQSPGWMHQWDVILKRGFSSLLWFPSLGQMACVLWSVSFGYPRWYPNYACILGKTCSCQSELK